jgi:hypothetical protein
MRIAVSILRAVALSFCVASCSRDFDIDLPANQSALVVECYLEDGQPMRALVTESTALLDTNVIPPVIMDAVVTITYGTQIDTLTPTFYIDSARNRIYNYGSSTIIRANPAAGLDYHIDVIDKQGRHAWGTTQFMKPVSITSLEPSFNPDNEASVITTFPDEAGMKNYYRLVIKRNAHYDSIQQNRLFTNDFANVSNNIIVRSGYRYVSGDSIHATLYHITHSYYQYLNTSNNARSALGNPFAASGEVVTNISGGLGVFAALSYTHKSIVIP